MPASTGCCPDGTEMRRAIAGAERPPARTPAGLREAAERLRARLSPCRVCPRRCGVDRIAGERGHCRVGRHAVVASAGPHFGEEPTLVGRNGSGTVFFSGCNLLCVFCQNYEISHGVSGDPVPPEELAELFLSVRGMGCHNLNLVTPTHVTPQIVEALAIAAGRGFSLPVVYNCGGYEDVETLELLDGIVDIYMPDVKFLDPDLSRRYASAPDYPDVVRAALREMNRQVGPLACGPDGTARRGLLIRHLVMPGKAGGLSGSASTTREVLEFVAKEIGTDACLNLMDQYRPCGRAAGFPEIARRVSRAEFEEALEAARTLGLTRLDGA